MPRLTRLPTHSVCNVFVRSFHSLIAPLSSNLPLRNNYYGWPMNNCKIFECCTANHDFWLWNFWTTFPIYPDTKSWKNFLGKLRTFVSYESSLHKQKSENVQSSFIYRYFCWKSRNDNSISPFRLRDDIDAIITSRPRLLSLNISPPCRDK